MHENSQSSHLRSNVEIPVLQRVWKLSQYLKSTDESACSISDNCGTCNDRSSYTHDIQPIYVGNSGDLFYTSGTASDNTRRLGDDIGNVNPGIKICDDDNNSTTIFLERDRTSGNARTMDNYFDVGSFVENLGIHQRTRSTITRSTDERQPGRSRGRRDTSMIDEVETITENQALLGFWSKLGSLYRQNRDGIIYPTVPYSTLKLANMWRGGAFYDSSIERICTEIKTDGRDYFHEALICLRTNKWDEVIESLKCTDIPGGIDFVERIEGMRYFRVTFSKTIRINLTDEGRTTSKCMLLWECKPKFFFESVYILCCHMIVIY